MANLTQGNIDTLAPPARNRRGTLYSRYWTALSWMYRFFWMVAFAIFISYELKAIGLALAWIASFWIEQISSAFPSLLTDFADAALMVLIGAWLKRQFEASADRCEAVAGAGSVSDLSPSSLSQ
ncbi:hypothetical protein K7573_20930 (plasmid) [Stenotrophomonas maltophilia]|uniref:hypothetical protein n=1 Tax=Stenotrophomonas maltophilia TaxID=40324 RepID=UPI001D118AE3|nr:hypothetical protein [Stenotrophomonas maltophilia]UXF78746.1 hypothetical protein K7573_20930 [Stenotrophomonas maltophilia]